MLENKTENFFSVLFSFQYFSFSFNEHTEENREKVETITKITHEKAHFSEKKRMEKIYNMKNLLKKISSPLLSIYVFVNKNALMSRVKNKYFFYFIFP